MSGGVDRTVRVRDLNNPNHTFRVLRGHCGGIKCIDVAEKGIIASGSNDNNVKLWDIFTGKFLRTLRGHSLEINAVCFVNDSSWLLTGSEDNMFRVWDVLNGTRLRIFKGHEGATISSIASIYVPGVVPPFAIIGGTERESYTSQLMNPIEIWRLDSTELVAKCTGHRDEVAALSVFLQISDGVILCEAISGGVDKSLRFWDLTTFLNDYLKTLEADDLHSLGNTEQSDDLSKIGLEENDLDELEPSLYSDL